MHPRKVSLKAPSGSQKCEQEKEKEMKFCKDCKWFFIENSPSSSTTFNVCRNEKAMRDVVMGKFLSSCAFIREECPNCHPTYCGPTAKWFEEKEKSIPLCLDCKHSQECGQGVSTYYTCQKKIYHKLTGAYVSGSIWGCEYTREGEHLCGKYGKWFEKKEVVPPGTVIKFELVKHPKDKSQSWICKLICGRKK